MSNQQIIKQAPPRMNEVSRALQGLQMVSIAFG